MGIPSYFSYIIKKHGSIIMRHSDVYSIVSQIHNLYLDSNSIIYDAVRKTPKAFDETTRIYEMRLYGAVCAAIDNYINIIRPTQRVIIAFDGVAPLAKLRQQRERRNRSWFVRHLCSGDKPETLATSWDTTAITPGTDFMRGLNSFVTEYFAHRAATTPTTAWRPRKIIVSGADIVGEGEHKLFEFIRNNGEHKHEASVVYGLDADLIVLALNHLRFTSNIFLAREAPHFAKELSDVVSDKELSADTLYFLDIETLGNDLIETIIPDRKSGATSSTAELLRTMPDIRSAKLMDYTLLTFFLGNDFLPHFPALNIRTRGVDTIMDAYKATYSLSETICTPGGQIQWKQLRRLIDVLARDEHENFMREMAAREKMELATWRREEEELRAIAQQEKHNRRADTHHPQSSQPQKPKSNNPASPEFREERLNRTPLLYRDTELYIDPSSRGWEGRYYEALFKSRPHRAFITRVCRQYMEGLEWVLGYYSNGCNNLRWKYDYHYAPLMRDLAPLIPHFNTTFVSEDLRPLDPAVQLAYVLPKAGLGLLPDKVREKVLRAHPEFYTDTFDFQWAFCKYFWEGHPILPEISIDELENTILGDERH